MDAGADAVELEARLLSVLHVLTASIPSSSSLHTGSDFTSTLIFAGCSSFGCLDSWISVGLESFLFFLLFPSTIPVVLEEAGGPDAEDEDDEHEDIVDEPDETGEVEAGGFSDASSLLFDD